MFRIIFKILALPIYRSVCWTRIINKKQLRAFRGKGVLICSNHKSNYDIPTMFCSIHRKLNFVAKESLFRRPIQRWFFTSLLGYPVRRGQDLALIRHSMKVLANNEAMLIFPEGMRAFDPDDALALRNGSSLIAVKAGVPILPIVMNRPPRPFRLTKIKIGEPISTEEFQGKRIDKAALTDLSNRVAAAMKEMLVGFEVQPKVRIWDRMKLDTARAIVIKYDSDAAKEGVELGNEAFEFGNYKMLFIKRNRPNYKDGADYYVTPGGHIDEGETAKQAVVREIKEETGIDVRPLRVLYKQMKPWGKVKDKEMEAFFACEYRGGEIMMNPESEEYAEDIAEKLDRYGRPVGTYEPVWVNLARVFEPDFNMRPEQVKEQLQKDLLKLGVRLVRQTKLLKDNPGHNMTKNLESVIIKHDQDKVSEGS